MKKRGSTLVVVLIIFSALLILGTAVSSAVVNTTKFNAKYSENIDLELAAKSGLNIFKEELIRNIKSVSNSSALPLAVTKGDSGITDFKDISITKEILRDDIKENGVLTGYKYTIISTAMDMSNYSSISEAEANNATQKQESQVITVNIDDEGDNSGLTLNPISFLSVKSNVYLGWSDLSVLNSISYGGAIERKNYTLDQSPNLDLREYNIKMNENKITEIISGLDSDEYVIDYNDFTQINGNTIIDPVTNIEDKKLIVNGNINFNTKVSKKIIIKDSVVILKDSLISSDEVEIILENSRLIVEKDILINNKSKISLTNSIIEVKGESSTSSISNIELNNSRYYSGKNLKSSTKMLMTVNNNSVVFVKGDLLSPETMECNVNNKSSLIIKGNATSSSTGFDVSLNNESIMLVNQINAPNKMKFTLNKSIFISNVIYSSTDVILELIESVAFIKEKLFSNWGFNANLNNSVLISLGVLNPLYEAKMINEGKSYVFCSGDFNTDKITILGEQNSIIPDSNFVIKTINNLIVN